MKNKKLLIILILKILETDTDVEHVITQTEMARIISNVYPCDRKTVGRNIAFLKKVGYPIVKTTNGFYMDKKTFAKEEIELVKEAILSSGGKNPEERKLLADKVARCMSKKYLIK